MLARVERGDRVTVGERGRRDDEVVRADGLAGAAQVRTDACVDAGGG